MPTIVPEVHRWEFVVGDATMELRVDEIVDAVAHVLGEVLL